MKPLGVDYAALARSSEPAGAGSRYRERPLLGARIRAMALTLAIYGSLALVMLTAQLRFSAPASPPPLQLPRLTVLPLAAPPEPVRDVPEGPRQVEQQERKPKQKEQFAPSEFVFPQLVAIEASPPRPVEAAPPADPVPQTTAPKALPVPPAHRASSDAERSWEALLLTHLEKYRRYPASAQARGAQGVAFVRFRMNRVGAVLSVEIARSSGSATLDRAALDTIRRAEPLPAIPQDKPDELDLSVPVEFFVRN